MDVAAILTSPVTWLVTAASVGYFFYWYGTSTFDYFSKQGIPGPKPLPYVGNVWGLWRQNFPKHDRLMVQKYGKTFGYFDGCLPNLWTIDSEIIKSVFVKDFDHFINRKLFVVQLKFFRKMVGLVRNQEWKEIRSSITPAFTTGKIKQMSVIIKGCAEGLVEKFQKIAENEGKLNAKKQFDAFSMDVITRSAFGMTIKNLGEEEDLFMKKAKAVVNSPVNKSPLIIIPSLFPNVMASMGDRMFPEDNFKFFFEVMTDLQKQRANSPEKYHDFVEIATEAITEYTEQEHGSESALWNKEDVHEIVTAQAVGFLLAGFDTTATTLTNTAFLLARHPEVQEKLYEEIVKKVETFGGISHDMLLDFPYLDRVIQEVLRMCPTAPRVERECNKDVTYNGIHIKKGVLVTVPSYALHYDEEYYPEPFKFNPDRWDPESQVKPNQYAYLPFGLGPRNCIGMRFAMEEIKIALCTIVKNFRFFPVPETPEELQFEDGFFLTVQPLHVTIGIETRSLRTEE